MDSLLFVNEVVLSEASDRVTFHMTLHAAASRCQSGSLPKNPEKAKQSELNLVHAVRVEKGELLVRNKQPRENCSGSSEERKGINAYICYLGCFVVVAVMFFF